MEDAESQRSSALSATEPSVSDLKPAVAIRCSTSERGLTRGAECHLANTPRASSVLVGKHGLNEGRTPSMRTAMRVGSLAT